MKILALSSTRAEAMHLTAGEEYDLPLTVAEQLIAIGRATPAAPQFPSSPRLWQRFTDHSGQRWIYRQPRDPDGTFSPDDITTPRDEAAPDWFRE